MIFQFCSPRKIKLTWFFLICWKLSLWYIILFATSKIRRSFYFTCFVKMGSNFSELSTDKRTSRQWILFPCLSCQWGSTTVGIGSTGIPYLREWPSQSSGVKALFIGERRETNLHVRRHWCLGWGFSEDIVVDCKLDINLNVNKCLHQYWEPRASQTLNMPNRDGISLDLSKVPETSDLSVMVDSTFI